MVVYRAKNPNVTTPEPRYLTIDEIKHIISVLPNTPGSYGPVRDSTHHGMMQYVVRALRNIKLTPDGIEDIRAELRRRYDISRVKPGKPVGSSVAEALGANIMQSTLNTRHKAGSASTTVSDFDALNELLMARKKRKEERVILHFKDRNLQLDEVQALKSRYVHITVEDIISPTIGAVTITNPADLEKMWWSDLWDNVNKLSIIMRIELNVNKMYAYDITPADVCRIIEKSKPTLVECFYGSLASGIIDIYPKEEAIGRVETKGTNIPNDIFLRNFFKDFLRPDFRNMYIKGYEGIKRFAPVITPMWSAIRGYERLDERGLSIYLGGMDIDKAKPIDEKTLEDVLEEKGLNTMKGNSKTNIKDYINNGRVWLLYKDQTAYYFRGLDDDRFIDFITMPELNIIVLDYNDDHYLIVSPPNTKDIHSNIIDKINGDENEYNRKVLEYIKEYPNDEYPDIEKSEFGKKAEYIYAVLDGHNDKVWTRDRLVDPTRSYCNNIYSLARILGIEAARLFYIHNVNEILLSTSEIDARHVILLADLIFGRGTPLGISFTGVSRQPGGPLSLAAIERARTVMTSAALDGAVESTDSVSAAVITGQTPLIGTGAYPYGVKDDDEMDEEVIRRANKGEIADIDDIEAALLNLSKYEGKEKIADNIDLDPIRREKEPTVRKTNIVRRTETDLRPDVRKSPPPVVSQVFEDALKDVQDMSIRDIDVCPIPGKDHPHNIPISDGVISSPLGMIDELIARLQVLQVIPFNAGIPSALSDVLPDTIKEDIDIDVVYPDVYKPNEMRVEYVSYNEFMKSILQ